MTGDSTNDSTDQIMDASAPEPAASATSTTAGAREHARAQGSTRVAAQPTLPASSAAAPDGVDPSRMVWAERVAGGNYTHKVLARGTVLRLTDVTGDACASILLYNADQAFERLNVADTVKVQWQVYSGPGQLLLSDQARVLASIEDDTSGHHDSIFGTSALLRNVERYGDGSPQGPSPAGRELLKLAGAKHGLLPRDIAPSVSFFQGVRIRDDGSPEYLGSAGAGASVTIRTELPVIVLIANAAHPLDPREEYHCGELDVVAWRDAPTTPDDPLWSSTPEGERAFLNTADYLTARGLS
ncbi:urea amidolyase associated protein UAAP1 [Marisediminicola senii]|uniref:urea amidolyase associated protein UAAP1 n=1 Tax=Marisediminicola senii TaxID=2711233 RepID=UPI001F3003CE|nr:urea amidolyase associated protein UAAP1 [Marisediminicola senii]